MAPGGEREAMLGGVIGRGLQETGRVVVQILRDVLSGRVPAVRLRRRLQGGAVVVDMEDLVDASDLLASSQPLLERFDLLLELAEISFPRDLQPGTRRGCAWTM